MAETQRNRWAYPSVILVASDLSDLDRLMPFAMEQAATTGARLILLHVITGSEAMASDAVGMPYYDPAGALDNAAGVLESCCEKARKRNIACDQVVREGNAAQQVVAASRQFNADRILLGTRSRSMVSKLLIGSVAEQVLRSVNIPVITVGPEAHLPVGFSEPARVILHATTLRETSRPSAVLASQIAATLKARLVLLHVLPPAVELEVRGSPTELESAALKDLQNLAAQTPGHSEIPAQPVVVHGNPSIEILAEASTRGAGLIVLGATHRSAFENLTRDRTIYKVLAHARCPVMTLREPQVNGESSVDAQVAAHV